MNKKKDTTAGKKCRWFYGMREYWLSLVNFILQIGWYFLKSLFQVAIEIIVNQVEIRSFWVGKTACF